MPQYDGEPRKQTSTTACLARVKEAATQNLQPCFRDEKRECAFEKCQRAFHTQLEGEYERYETLTLYYFCRRNLKTNEWHHQHNEKRDLGYHENQ